MNSRYLSMGCVVLLFAAGARAMSSKDSEAAVESTATPQQQARLDALQEKGVDCSLTIYPVNLAGESSKDVADVVGMFLEKGGMEHLETTEVAFLPPADADFARIGELFGQFVAEKDVSTEYCLYAQILGSHKEGVKEVRAVIVDRTGDLIWTDRQTERDADFKRIKPRNPMTCCVLLNERLTPVFGLKEGSGPGREGKMAKLWAEKSGLPPEDELNAIEQRCDVLKNADKPSLTIYPVFLLKEVDCDSAQHLAELIGKENLFRVTASEEGPDFEVKPNSNEQKRLWDLARGFRDYVRATPPSTDYALLAEYTIRPANQEVWTVHFVVCSAAGEWVIVDYQNNHHEDFQSVNPKSRDDCGALIVRRLKGYLR
ncbi:MAG: hypothetical protein JSV78_04735 [Phycisphaerales bacterium]|nr:MAG: hypothetical protein JSV78_04735 [Phycisphaerales bacterium]